MSGYINIWMTEIDFNYMIKVLEQHESDGKKTITITISDYIPDFDEEPDESTIPCVYASGKPYIEGENKKKVQSRIPLKSIEPIKTTRLVETH